MPVKIYKEGKIVESLGDERTNTLNKLVSVKESKDVKSITMPSDDAIIFDTYIKMSKIPRNEFEKTEFGYSCKYMFTSEGWKLVGKFLPEFMKHANSEEIEIN